MLSCHWLEEQVLSCHLDVITWLFLCNNFWFWFLRTSVSDLNIYESVRKKKKKVLIVFFFFSHCTMFCFLVFKKTKTTPIVWLTHFRQLRKQSIAFWFIWADESFSTLALVSFFQMTLVSSQMKISELCIWSENADVLHLTCNLCENKKNVNTIPKKLYMFLAHFLNQCILWCVDSVIVCIQLKYCHGHSEAFKCCHLVTESRTVN